MQDRKTQQQKAHAEAKAERLAEALRANLGKRKALARTKKARSTEASGDAFEMPKGTGTDEDADAERPLRSTTAND